MPPNARMNAHTQPSEGPQIGPPKPGGSQQQPGAKHVSALALCTGDLLPTAGIKVKTGMPVVSMWQTI